MKARVRVRMLQADELNRQVAYAAEIFSRLNGVRIAACVCGRVRARARRPLQGDRKGKRAPNGDSRRRHFVERGEAPRRTQRSKPLRIAVAANYEDTKKRNLRTDFSSTTISDEQKRSPT